MQKKAKDNSRMMVITVTGNPGCGPRSSLKQWPRTAHGAAAPLHQTASGCSAVWAVCFHVSSVLPGLVTVGSLRSTCASGGLSSEPLACLSGASNWGVFSVQFSYVRLFVTPWTTACQASLTVTNSRNLLKLMSIKLVMPSNHLILCHPLLFLLSIFPSIRVFSNESVLRIRWPKYWSCSFSISVF